MKRKLSLVLVMVMVLNLVAMFTTLLPVTHVSAVTTETITLINDTFDSYANVTELQAVWTGTTRALQTGGPTGSTKFLRSSGFSASGSVKKTFANPVVLTAAGGSSPGNNAKLITEYYVNGVNYTSGNSCYWGITNSTMTNSNSIKYAVGVATRGGDTGAALRYASYIGSVVSGDVLLAGTGGDLSGGWHKVKFVINITDAAGAFLATGPTVEAYIDGGTTNVLPANKPLMNTAITYVDEFRVSGSHATRYADTDAVSIYLTRELADNQTTEPPAPTDTSALVTAVANATALLNSAVEGALEGQYTTARIAALTAAIATAQGVIDNPDSTQPQIDVAVVVLNAAITAFTPNTATPKPIPTIEPDGTLYTEDFQTATGIVDVKNVRNATDAVYGIIDNGTSKYLKISKGTSNIGPAFDLCFNPVQVKAGTAPSSATNVITPPVNSVIVAQFDVRAVENSTTNRTSQVGVAGLSASGASQNLAMMYHWGVVGTGYYTYGKPAAAGTPSIPTGFTDKYVINPVTSGGWYTVKMVIPVTDPSGSYIGSQNNINIYVDGQLTEIADAPFINSGSIVADRISIKESNFYSATATDGSEGFALDNVSVKLQTAEPTPTPVPVDKTALLAKIAEAEALLGTVSQNIGTLEGQYDAALVAALTAAIPVAQGVCSNGAATQDEVNAAVVALQAVIDTIIPNPPTPTPTAVPAPIIPEGNIVINSGGTITNPYGKVDASIVRVDVTGIIDPTVDNWVVMVKGVEAKYTYYNGAYKFVALVDGVVTTADVSVVAGTPTQLIYADVNLNGSTDSTDVNLLKGAVAGNRTATNYFEFIASDLNGEGAVNSSDYNVLKGFIAGNLAVLAIYSK